MAPAYTQDMPPAGGFGAIKWARIPSRRTFMTYYVIGGVAQLTILGAYFIYGSYRKYNMKRTEARGCHLAIYPLVVAQQERLYLKQLRLNRDEEAELMKDVPNWKVGHWYDRPVYNHHPEDLLPRPSSMEFYAHVNPSDYNKRTWFGLYK